MLIDALKKMAAPKQAPEKEEWIKRPLTAKMRRKMAARPPSFTEHLPWAEFDEEADVLLHVDGRTMGVMLELQPIATEAMHDEFMDELRMKVQTSLNSLDEVDPPWIAQFFLNDDRDLTPVKRQVERYIQAAYPKDPQRSAEIFASEYTQHFLADTFRHLDRVSHPDGLFRDTQVTGQVWRGQLRRVRCVLYRTFLDDAVSPLSQLEQASSSLLAGFQQMGVSGRRCNKEDFFKWMLPFFNRSLDGVTADELTSARTKDVPVLSDLSESLTLNVPKSDIENGVWEFDGVSIKALVLQSMTAEPSIGHFTAEQRNGKNILAKFDKLPEGAMLSMTVVIKPQHVVRMHIERIKDRSRARTADAIACHAEAGKVLHRMSQGDKLLPMTMVLYIPGRNQDELRKAITAVNAELAPSGLRFIDPRYDLTPLDSFLRGLPMAFDVRFDEKEMRRSRYVFCSHIAAMLPIYGRCRGSGNPGFQFWNRGGETLFIDPLSSRDRKKNAHMLVLGPTGAGKSATLASLCRSAMAIYRPRMIICDAGKSFRLVLDHFKSLGITTHVVELTASADVSLPPFVNACRLLDNPDVVEMIRMIKAEGSADRAAVEEWLEEDPTVIEELEEDRDASEAEEEESERRDLLGEMKLAAMLMVTGGEKKEAERMTRADRYLIGRAIVLAALEAKHSGKPHPLTQDVAAQLMNDRRDSSMSEPRRIRAEEMGQAMMEFCSGLRGKFFNRYGADWPEVDVILIEMGVLTNDGSEDALALAYTSVVDCVQARGEKYQAIGRPLIFLTDESHLITTNDLLGPKLAKASKMWRKLGIWLWLATQNMKDFPDSMSRVLSMCEWWMLLVMDKSEIDEVSRFRSLTKEQRALLESAVKEPPKYTEGVILSPIGEFLIRNVPPSTSIALAMTESHEKADRLRLMKQFNCSELEAAYKVAEQLEVCR